GVLRDRYPTVPLIVLSGTDTPADVRSVLRAGAAGFIPKTAMARLMLQAIRLVLAGGQYLPPQLMQALDTDLPPPAGGAAPARADAPGSPSAQGPLAMLSPRQREVFALLARGLSNKLIARELDVTEGTVKSHVATIFDVLNVHNRVSAVAEARKLAGEQEARSRDR
ncbi:MAG TPA: response regulator transcription factor, partial [Casimicrobiaceae bacterium]